MKTLLLGDLSPTGVTNPLFEKEDVEALFQDAVSLFEGNDVNFVNLECALTDWGRSIEKYGPPLKACAQVADTLKKIGVAYCGLSNNHIFDYGIQGALDTMQTLDRAGITYTGFGKDYEDSRKNLYIEKNGEKIAVIAVCEHEYSYALKDRMGSRPYDEYDTMEDIRLAKNEADRVIVIYHGGKEHCRYPSPRLMKACRAMVKNGADVVLCQHSHCIGCYEKYQNGHILYGQGNFHFVYEEAHIKDLIDTWNSALAVKYDSETNEILFIPIVVKGEGIALAKGAEKDEIMDAFEARSAQLSDGTWEKGWEAFCEKSKKQYTDALIHAFKQDATPEEKGMFGHYLDCEAHTDVWRQLFPTANKTNERK